MVPYSRIAFGHFDPLPFVAFAGLVDAFGSAVAVAVESAVFEYDFAPDPSALEPPAVACPYFEWPHSEH